MEFTPRGIGVQETSGIGGEKDARSQLQEAVREGDERPFIPYWLGVPVRAGI